MKFCILAPAMLMLVLLGCTTAPSDVPVDPSYATDVQPIFSANCVTCHGTSSPSGGYSLTSHAGATGPGSDTIPNVIPSAADSSKLYHRVTGTVMPQMPKERPPLNAVQLTTIKKWIDQGAKNN